MNAGERDRAETRANEGRTACAASDAPELEAPGGERWHSFESGEVTKLLGGGEGGLTSAAIERLSEFHGPNRLVEEELPSPWVLFFEQFKGLLILVLVGAALLAALIGDFKDAAVILVVVLLNAILGFVQEHRAGQAVAALRRMLAPNTRVRRDGCITEIAASDLVPGDVVLLEAGDRVPADGRLIISHSLETDESSLTGESHPVPKHAEVVLDSNAPLADRTNMAHMNTNVTRGRAEIIVTATGMRTEMGRLAALLAATESEPTPLQQDLDRLGKRLAGIAIAVIGLILVLGVLRGEEIAEIVLTSITLAVAAIPEGLPAVVTITLALGMHRMARRRAIVKRLASVETLGCTTVICSDKTGTLTLNEMTARRFVFRGQRFNVTGGGYTPDGEIRLDAEEGALPDLDPLLVPLALCNDSEIRDGDLIGDPTEGALLTLAVKGGVERADTAKHLPRIAEIPFDAAHKFMATFHFAGETVELFVKGAPEVLLGRCTSVLGPEGEEAIGGSSREAVLKENDGLASEALRVLAVAVRRLPAEQFDPAADLFSYVAELSLVGLVGLMDPPRPEVRASIGLCREAGIEVKMITGDQRTTAAAIGEELGLRGAIVSGADLDATSERELTERVDDVAIFARVAPEHKVRIVQALKANGHVVAMTGDGVNDAPALRNADIGVAMGRTGTDVTKEAAALVLTDDNFATIVGAVKEGRTIHDNIGKFLRFQLSTNFGAVLCVLTAPLFGLPLPFDPIQILWVNLIMDGPPAMALGVDPARPGIMQVASRARNASMLPVGRVVRQLVLGSIMAAGTLGVLWHGLDVGSPEHARTLAFTTFVTFQIFNLFNVRDESASAFGLQTFANRSLWLALGAVVALQLLATNWAPAQTVFDTSELSAGDGLLAAGVGAAILVVEELRKAMARALGRDGASRS
ncbi:MAG: HAD-IC family P-type ATPase [Deltaproteobacteria bacterium]|nr:HAD-IC family P-type ATPase [Deltaproteobacteria bacterium]